MPRDTRGANQSQSKHQENEKPQAAHTNPNQNSMSQKDDEEIVDIDHDDVEMQDPSRQEPSTDELGVRREPSTDELGLQRLSARGDGDEDDSSEDEPDHMANHPLLSMLTGRMGQRRRGSNHKWDVLHPVTQVLSPANVDDCTKLEEEAFPENERCSREKFEYRLTRCPELSLGLFSRPTEAQCKDQASPPKRRLIGHVVATRTPSPSVTDASMALPPEWKTNKSTVPKEGEEAQGHQDVGGTICIHSVAVAKEHQKIGLGSILLKSYVQRIKDSKCAERIALLAHDHLTDFYTGLGFENMGPSSAQFGGGEWHNLVLEFTNTDDDD